MSLTELTQLYEIGFKTGPLGNNTITDISEHYFNRVDGTLSQFKGPVGLVF